MFLSIDNTNLFISWIINLEIIIILGGVAPHNIVNLK